eukprot:TRINITY_DN15274_c0_g1_i1.p1 TRINITY_DN15274_c0_g1~~TRINITY_DN15274_c0_g1_i1.p1  ORF type:complete len:228 (-),score=51.10 TRINITY_DN15274_c0_g1_i1:127-810(-)
MNLLGFGGEQKVHYDDIPTPVTDEDYIKIFQETKQNVLKWEQGTEEWKPVDVTYDDITLYEQEFSDNSGIYCMKAAGIIYNCSPQELLNINWEMDLKKRPWDKELVDLKLVKTINETTEVTQSRISAPYPVSHREFVDARCFSKESDGTIIFMTNSINCDIPQSSGCVRATNMSGMIMRPIQGQNAIHLTFVGKVNPRGWVPGMVVNMFKTKFADRIVELRKIFEKK